MTEAINQVLTKYIATRGWPGERTTLGPVPCNALCRLGHAFAVITPRAVGTGVFDVVVDIPCMRRR